MWRLWSYALGRKEGRTDREANVIATIRTLILFSYFITNCFIVAGVIRHWNNSRPCSSVVEQLSCKQQVVSSNLIGGFYG